MVHVEIDDRDALGAVRASARGAPRSATLLNRQKPIGRSLSAWWPGGRTATKAFSAAGHHLVDRVHGAAGARIDASNVPGDIEVSASRWTMPSFGVASRIASM